MSKSIVDEFIELFDEYRENFGLGSDPEHHWALSKQCEFEDKFSALICIYKGHDVSPDQCCRPEHDFCYRCGKLASELGYRRTESFPKEPRYIHD